MVKHNFYSTFYEDLLPAVKEIYRKYGPLYLCVVLRIDEGGGEHWVLLLGSPKLVKDVSIGTAKVAEILAKRVSDVSSLKIRRIGILIESDPVVQAFIHAFAKQSLDVTLLENVNLFGL